jgi:glycerate kinase
VARAAAAHCPAAPVVAVAGRCTLTAGQLRAAGIAACYALADLEPDLSRSIAQAGPLVERLAEQIAADWLLRPGGYGLAVTAAG